MWLRARHVDIERHATGKMPSAPMPLTHFAGFHAEVLRLQRHVREFLASRERDLATVHPLYRRSAQNLLAYTALRQIDLRKLQLGLSQRGLSSLGRCEGHVLSSLDQLQMRLEETLGQRSGADLPSSADELTWSESEKLLHRHTQALLGDKPAPRHVHIMVTAPDEAPDEVWCSTLLGAGMSVLRINTAHGTLEDWRKTAHHARRAAAAMSKSIRILVDLEGPKIRTTPIVPGPTVVRYRPIKDALGRVSQSLRVLVIAASAPRSSTPVEPLRVPDDWLSDLRVGDKLHTQDTRDRSRDFLIVEVAAGVAVAEIARSTYLSPESTLSWRRGGNELETTPVLGLQATPGEVEVRPGDELQICLDAVEGKPGVRHPTQPNLWLSAPRIGVDLGGVDISLKPGHRVLIDDGKIEAMVSAIDGNIATAKIVRTSRDSVKIRGEKGVNFPDSEIRAAALSPQDRTVLGDVVGFTDAVGISFVRTPLDLRDAVTAIQAEPRATPAGVIVKLETAYALHSLPELLLEAMRHYPAGLMIARGDLAVEVGFERLAEVQQEILWFCEAAHLPVIWATQVLDTLARTGIPSRAEITDASMSVQAECVMLNKGPHVAEACRTLDTILQKMEQHQYKKRTLYRPLQISMSMPMLSPLASPKPEGLAGPPSSR